jgi:hypothetical protein
MMFAFVHDRKDQMAAVLADFILALIRDRKSQKAAILGRTFRTIDLIYSR